MINNLAFKSLGLSNYQETYESMIAHISLEKFHNEVWFLEHPPIYTLGTAADKSHILDAGNIPIIQADRGGEVTYHGPGQLVIYFMLDVKQLELGPKNLVKNLQNFIKELLEEFSIESNFIDGAPGVYTDEKKIASIGLRISKGRSYHGISINVDMDLKPFTNINPCGYSNLQVTQIKNYKKDVTITAVINKAKKILSSY